LATIAKKSKTRRQPESAAAALDELESLGDRLAAWAAEHVALLVGVGVGLLVLVGAIGVLRSSAESSRLERVEALALAEEEFRAAMGAEPGSVELPEPANPAIAREAREAALARYQALAEDASGTVEGSLAALRAGELQAELGDPAAAVGTWRTALEGLSGDSPVRGLLLVQMAGSLEAQGEGGEAGAAYAEAADLDDYPLRDAALAEAARAYAQAGEVDAALQAFDELEARAPEFRVAPHVRTLLSELRARRAR